MNPICYRLIPKKDIPYYKKYNVRFEVFTAVTMKNAVFWDVAPCRSGENRRFGGPSVRISTWRYIPEDGILQNKYKLELFRCF
jgi:hypothetical protein